MSILKKIFFLSVFMLCLSALFWGVYNLAFKGKKIAIPDMDNRQGEASREAAEGEGAIRPEEKIMAISEEAVVAPALSFSGEKILYYAKNSGQAYEIDLFGKDGEIIASQKFSNLEDVLWSSDRMKTILKINKGDKNSFKFFDFSTNLIKDIKDNTDEIAWQANADRIFYKYYEPLTGSRSISVSDPDGGNWSKLTDVPHRNVSIAQIPKSGMVSFWNTGDANEKTSLRAMPIIGGESKIIFQEGFGADYLWQPSGEYALLSQANAKGGNRIKLGIIDYEGKSFTDLNIPTFVSKCAWSRDGKTVFYALPGGIPEDAVLPNEYKEGKFNTSDTFWKVDIETKEKTRLVELEDMDSSYDASNIFLDESEGLLFFVNRIDGRLYRIAL